MMKNLYTLIVFVIVFTIISIFPYNTFSQNVAITDDDSYTPDQSAMLDVMSTDKGMLVPRMSTTERLAIGLPGTPAIGLLVYDTNFNNFYYYNGLSWMSFSPIGTSGIGGALFHVINSYGDTIFAVYDDGVQIVVPIGVKGKVGGFAVSGRSPSKVTGLVDNYLVITPDSARIYINDTVSAKGKVGGFAVSGRSPSKGGTNDIIFASVDSTRIYVDESNSKGKVGGFAVSGRSPSKSITNSFLNLSSQNYFIGHRAGESVTTGLYNTFIGYETGIKSTGGNGNMFIGYHAGFGNVDGALNVFIGNEVGYNFTGAEDGEENIFIGNNAGFNCTTTANSIFIGTRSGYNCGKSYGNTFVGDRTASGGIAGEYNTLIGASAGFFTNGDNNVYLGSGAGRANAEGNNNTFIGVEAGANSTGSGNVFLGYYAGDANTGDNKLYISNNSITTLIYGDFATKEVIIDGVLTAENVTPSDINLKTNLLKINSGLKLLTSLTGYYFNWNELAKKEFNYSDDIQIGVIAQDVEKVFPQLVVTNSKGYKSVEYSKFAPIIIQAIKEQQNQIDELQKIINIKSIELEESDNTTDQINLLMEENKKLKQEIAYIKELLQSNKINE